MHEKMPCLQHVKSRCESLQVDSFLPLWFEKLKEMISSLDLGIHLFLFRALEMH